MHGEATEVENVQASSNMNTHYTVSGSTWQKCQFESRIKTITHHAQWVYETRNHETIQQLIVLFPLHYLHLPWRAVVKRIFTSTMRFAPKKKRTPASLLKMHSISFVQCTWKWWEFEVRSRTKKITLTILLACLASTTFRGIFFFAYCMYVCFVLI